jgi:2,4-dienoyl-CoA reductase-like NADH-dependent reductase (Old Yellow Enzyme family)
MPHLFEPLQLRDVLLFNRVIVSPMCQYSAYDGMPADWHLVHLGSRAVGGAGLVIVEATAVRPDGRISPADLGLWDDRHAEAYALITRFVRMQGSAVGVQLAHGGRKASTKKPWEGSGAVQKEDGGWDVVGATVEAFSPDYPEPRALDEAGIEQIVRAFRDAAVRAQDAGFNVLEIHAAHGYLIHQFLSPLVNTRTDRYGGTFENRIRLCVDVVAAVRAVWPERLPLLLRLSVTDWLEGGWNLEQSLDLAKRVAKLGVDLIDCSSGGAVARARVPVGPGYQVPFAAEVKAAGIAAGAVGMITSAEQADQIIRTHQADCVLLGRELLRDPYWPLHAAQKLGHAVPWPAQYLRAAPHGATAR